MCKLAGWTSSKDSPLPKAAADRAIMAALAIIKTTERDGFGIAQFGDSGLRVRCQEPAEFGSIDSIPLLWKRSGKAAKAFKTSFRSDFTGVYKQHASMIIHGRTATCGVSLNNTHPFRKDGWTLAHNGVVSWNGAAGTDHDKITCDSQHLLIEMANNPDMKSRMTGMLDITGSAAFLALDPKGNMTVAVDDRAQLYAGITARGRWIFGTKPTIVDAIADAFNAKGVTPYPIDNWSWLEISKDGGDPEVFEWSHGEASTSQLGFAQRSLGYTPSTSTYGTHHRYSAYSTPAAKPTQQDWRWDGYGAPTKETALTAEEVADMSEDDRLALADAADDGMALWDNTTP